MPYIIDIEPPPGCLVRFISDLHLAHKRSTAPTPAQLLEHMEGVGMLVLCGDTVELREHGPIEEKSLACREELRQLCEQKGIRLIEIAGNHDPYVEPMLVRFWGGKVAATHGHAVLDVVSPWSREYLEHKEAVHAILAAQPNPPSLEARLERTRLVALELARQIPERHKKRRGILQELRHCFWPPGRPLRIVWNWLTCCARTERWMHRYMPDTELLVFGHFHRSGRWHRGKLTLLNTGAWFEHATPYAVDMKDGQLLRYFSMHHATKHVESRQTHLNDKSPEGLEGD